MFSITEYHNSLCVECADLFPLTPIIGNRKDTTALLITTGIN